MKVMQVRIDSDLQPLVRKAAKQERRSIPGEVNNTLRRVYKSNPWPSRVSVAKEEKP